ncbi:hypothetical protein [Micromonospora sp. DH14]|uniref:hypothetical protein n=1 Tax=Micromonospora sp. DH14 TaxID=3040120 RepID=UPI002441FE90|nr:hypothetical protein [Micromonospora sp. DH14]MDG9675964.1 hypothetical protein [Micromonospora sp. DH14]
MWNSQANAWNSAHQAIVTIDPIRVRMPILARAPEAVVGTLSAQVRCGWRLSALPRPGHASDV